MADSTTWEFLKELGFQRCGASTWTPQVQMDFGSFVLKANLSMNRYFRESIIISGIYRTPNEMGEIEFELMPNLLSRDQCSAMIYYYLRHYDVTKIPQWFNEAANNQHLLPWLARK